MSGGGRGALGVMGDMSGVFIALGGEAISVKRWHREDYYPKEDVYCKRPRG